MSAPDADPSLVSVEKLFIGDNLNSVVLFTFLMGIYTIVYFGTLSLYSMLNDETIVIRKGSQRRMVIFSITLLYMLGVIMLSVQWYDLEWIFVVNGATRESIFTATITSPGWTAIIKGICTVYMVVIADGLLIWRCFFVWNKSLRVIGLPCLLFLGEILIQNWTKNCPIVLSFAETIIVGEILGHLLPSKAGALAVAIQSALFFTSLSSSLLATLLIAFRIHSISKQDGRSQRRFGHVIEIVVQSAAAYSLALLLLGVFTTISSSSPLVVAFNTYGMAVAFTITGIAPTVMVARVCLAADTSIHVLSTIHTLSGLHFQGQSTRQNATQIMVEDAPEVNVEVILPEKSTGHFV